MIMQIVFHGSGCHLRLVYYLDSHWHNFDSAGENSSEKTPPILTETTSIENTEIYSEAEKALERNVISLCPYEHTLSPHKLALLSQTPVRHSAETPTTRHNSESSFEQNLRFYLCLNTVAGVVMGERERQPF